MPALPGAARPRFFYVPPVNLDIVIRPQRADHPQVVAALEATMHRQGVTLAWLETGGDQLEAIRLYERCGYKRRGPFGGYPDSGLSLFFEKRL